MPSQNYPNIPAPRSNFQNQNRNRFLNLPPFPKLSISNADLFQRLVDAYLISAYPVWPLEPPFPAWYNLNVTCKYHMDIAGHSIEDCEGFKTAVRKLIACGRLDLQEESKPDIVHNPMPNHEGGGRVNALEVEESLIKKVLNLRTPMERIFTGLNEAGYKITASALTINENEKYDMESSCMYHYGGLGHDIENCWDFKARVQELLNLGVIQAKKGLHTPDEVNVIEPFILQVPLLNPVSKTKKVVITMKRPTPFGYDNTHVVP